MQKVFTIVKANGQTEPFYREKLLNSLIRAGAQKSVAEEMVTHIESELKDGMSTSQIYKHAFFLLRKKTSPVAVRYSLRRAVMDLGPSGFPFEDFIALILKEKGYAVKTGERVFGGCVEHEVDVVAWNENKLIMVEAKFHNELGIKTDLKVALYVKARFDDLKEAKHLYGKERDVDEAWLVTNTKFTSTAIHYAGCKGLQLIGWNYPEKDNLHNMINDSGLHPLTCLTTLTGSQKRTLLENRIVLSKDLKNDSSPLRSLGMDDKKIQIVLDEVALFQ
jgi:hypothetical protein